MTGCEVMPLPCSDPAWMGAGAGEGEKGEEKEAEQLELSFSMAFPRYLSSSKALAEQQFNDDYFLKSRHGWQC